LQPMFPLSCARVRAHTGRGTSTQKKTWSAQKKTWSAQKKTWSTQKKTWSAQNIFLPKMFCTYLMRIITNADESW